jgi:hypothetical protein
MTDVPSSGVLPFGGVQIRAAQTASLQELMAKARRSAMDPSVFDDHAPFFGRATISTNRTDSYFTRMRPSSLKNFARDAAEGRSVLTGHNHQSLGVGYSLTGEYIADGEDGRVESDFYTVRGLPDTEDVITRIRSGLVRDTSIGFYGGDIICSICGLSWMDWECQHIPGLSYPVDGGENGRARRAEGEREVAFGDVEDSHLAEYSLVFDGATPGCGLLKAYREVDAGRVNPDTARSIENRFRVRLPGNPSSHRYPGFTHDRGNSFGATTAAEAVTITDPGTGAPLLSIPLTTASGTNGTITTIPPERQDSAATDRIETTTTPQETEQSPMPTDQEREAAGSDEQDEDTDETTAATVGEVETPATLTDDEDDTDEAAGAARQNDPLRFIRRALVAAGQPADRDAVTAIREMASEIRRLAPLADDGRRYRADLIREALAEGVRAFGNGFATERYTALLQREATTLDDIIGFRNDWRTIANEVIPAGRSTRDHSERPTEARSTSTAAPKVVTPDAAFVA